MKNKNESYVFILGQSFPRVELIKLGFIAFLVVLIPMGGGVFWFLDWREQQLARPGKLEETSLIEESAVLAKAETDPLEVFFQDYFALTRLDRVDSVRALGAYEAEGLSLDCTFLAKRPRLYRQTFRRDATEIKYGFDGEQVWISQNPEALDGKDSKMLNGKDSELTTLNRHVVLLESAILCLAWGYGSKVVDPAFECMPDAVWNGHACYVIKNTGLIKGSAVYHYIDKITGFEWYRRVTVQVAVGRSKDVELLYDLPLDDSEYPLPSGMELRLDGVLRHNVNFTRVQVNMGLASFLFRVPVSQ